MPTVVDSDDGRVTAKEVLGYEATNLSPSPEWRDISTLHADIWPASPSDGRIGNFPL